MTPGEGGYWSGPRGSSKEGRGWGGGVVTELTVGMKPENRDKP